MKTVVSIPKNEYRVVHFYEHTYYKVKTSNEEQGYWCITNSEVDMVPEEAEWHAFGPRALNAGQVFIIDTSTRDFKTIRYSKAPTEGEFGTMDADLFVRARGCDIIVITSDEPIVD